MVVWGNTTEDLFAPFLRRLVCQLVIYVIKIRGERIITRNLGRIVTPLEVEQLCIDYNAVILVPYSNRIKRELDSLRNKPKRVFYIDVAKLHLHSILFKKVYGINIAS